MYVSSVEALQILLLMLTTSALSDDPATHCLWPGHDDACRFCESGWWGRDCARTCSSHCHSAGCHKITGRCVSCAPGFYSEDCSLPCPEHCNEGVEGGVHCERATGHCREDCQHGWWGDRCSNRCNQNCRDSICFSYDGSCVWGCKDGWAGDTCTENCPGECKHNKCTLYGRCVQGCNTGFYGERCESRCSSNCTNSDCVYVHDVICREGCKAGLMSSSCDEPCPPGCETCHQHTGDCITCTAGYYGPGCDRLCNVTCVSPVCDVTGQCNDGCRQGYHGRFCDMECDTNCVECKRTNGECLVCRTEWDEKKHACAHVMPILEDSGNVQDADSPVPRTVIIGVVAGCVALLVTLVVLVIGCRYKRRGEGEERLHVQHRLLSEEPQHTDSGSNDGSSTLT